jgi:hypothetical protein
MNKNNVLDRSIIMTAIITSLITLSLCTLVNCASVAQDKQIPKLPSAAIEKPIISNDLSYFSDSQSTTEQLEELKDSNIIYTMQVILYDKKGKMKEQLTLKPSDKR